MWKRLKKLQSSLAESLQNPLLLPFQQPQSPIENTFFFSSLISSNKILKVFSKSLSFFLILFISISECVSLSSLPSHSSPQASARLSFPKTPVSMVARNNIRHLQYHIQEEVKVGYVVGSLLEDSGVMQITLENEQTIKKSKKKKPYSSRKEKNRYRNKSSKNVDTSNKRNKQAYSKNIFFRFLAEPSIAIGLGNKDGVLKTIGRIDRESLCGSKSECIVRFDVFAQSMDLFQTFKITLLVDDVNDHLPTFQNSPK